MAKKLRGLWTQARMFDALDDSAERIQAQRAWNDGWIAVRETLQFDVKRLNENDRERLHQLEKLLKPADLLEQARTFALSDQHRTFDLGDDLAENEEPIDGWRRAEDTTRKIGAQVAQSTDTLKALLPDLVSAGGGRLHIFGRGLADGCTDKPEMFRILRAAIEQTALEKRNVSVLFGFLSASAESDHVFYSCTLDSLVSDRVLGQWFPIFQTNSTIDQRGVERLHDALDLGIAEIHTFQYLARGRAHESIGDDELAGLLTKILAKKNGVEVVVEILIMRFHGRNKESPNLSDGLVAVTRDVLSMYEFEEKHGRRDSADNNLADLANNCFTGTDGIEAATRVGQKLIKALIAQRVYAFDYPKLLESVAKAQPLVFLDVFLGGDDADEAQRASFFAHDSLTSSNPLNQIPDGELLSWCEIDSFRRYPLVASSIQPFTQSAETGKLEWKSVVYAIFQRTPNLDAVLEHLADVIRPGGCTGSLADILQARVVLFQDLQDYDNAKIRAWAEAQYSNLQVSIQKQREWEEKRGRERDGRFE